MAYQLAQLNIARFSKPAGHPDNADFVNNVDRVYAVAESQPGFVWRWRSAGNEEEELRVFKDPNLVVNMSVWQDLESLSDFSYRNEAHLSIMRRKKEWFEKTEIHLVLWWVASGHIPSLDEANQRLKTLTADGPSEQAFTFRNPFSAPQE